MAIAVFRFVRIDILKLWISYCVGDLINQIFFNGGLNYIDLIISTLALGFVFYKIPKENAKAT